LIEPHAGETEELLDDSKPEGVSTLNTMANSVMKGDNTNLIYFGESIHSFRQLLKRYNLHSHIMGTTQTAGDLVRVTSKRSAFPLKGGYTTMGSSNSLVYSLADGNYVYAHMTLLNYVTSAYAGWRGGIRWMADLTRMDSQSGELSNITVTRKPSGFVGDSWTLLSNPTWTAAGQAELLSNVFVQGHNGSLYQSSAVNPVVMWECPYYNNIRFSPAKRLFHVNDVWDTCWVLEATMSASEREGLEYIPLYCAAAEDFNCFFYLGPPIFYYEPAVPSS
jgi:hypothetical protein